MPDPAGIVQFITAQLDADEKRLRASWYGETHWGMLRNRLHLGAWTVSRENGVSAALNDQITDAGLAFMRELFEQWEADYAEPRLADIAAKRQILALHMGSYAKTGDGARHYFCQDRAADPDFNGDLWAPCLTARLLAAPYADRKGWKDEWAPAAP
jgi:hypothetical protein